MIVTRAPLRISFIGGGTDLPNFFSKYDGRVISTTIDKFVYVVVNKTLRNNILLKYSITEEVPHPSLLRHTRVKAALLDLGVHEQIEIASLADISSKVGLGSSSSFSVALLKSLNLFLNKNLDKKEAADQACRLEIEILKEPIGKQDQYAAAFGGFNIFNFKKDGSVSVESVLLDSDKKDILEKSVLLFLTGQFRDACSVLGEQKILVKNKIKPYRAMMESVYPFRDALVSGNIKLAGKILDKNWQLKKTLCSKISNKIIDKMYESGMKNGAYGGKILGAGGGGAILFLAPPEKHKIISNKLKKLASTEGLDEFRKIPVKFSENGVEVLFESN